MYSFQKLNLYLCTDQSSELSQALKKSQLELADALTECQHLRLDNQRLQEHMTAAQKTVEVSSTYGQELEAKEARISQLLKEGRYGLTSVVRAKGHSL